MSDDEAIQILIQVLNTHVLAQGGKLTITKEDWEQYQGMQIKWSYGTEPNGDVYFTCAAELEG